MRVAVVTNTAWNVANFRVGLINRLCKEGHVVTAFAGADASLAVLINQGVEFTPLPLRSAGTNPIFEFWSVISLRQRLRRAGIQLCLSYTPKGNLYSLMACLGLPIVCIPNISGMGSAFLRPGPVSWLLRLMYWVLLRRAAKAFFQNPEDLRAFVDGGLLEPGRAALLPGSGIDIDRFAPELESGDRQLSDGAVTFLMLSRALWDKGLEEYVEAARLIKKLYPEVRFQFAGSLNSENPSAVNFSTLKRWFSEGHIDYLGVLDDVRPAIKDASCIVLPSYREGLSRTLLEAGALGRPVVTTTAAGCRHAVVEGVTGLLCEVRSAESLRAALEKIILMGPDGRAKMGQNARTHIVEHYSERLVHDAYISAISELVAASSKKGAILGKLTT